MKEIYLLLKDARYLAVLALVMIIANAGYGQQLVINEVHADPAGDITGDANGDGVRDVSDDEFIEFVNNGASVLDISGWIISDTNSTPRVRHIFPSSSLVPAGGAIVVFGGGKPTGEFGGAIVQLASSGSLGISNSNEGLFIIDTKEDTVTSVIYPDFNDNQSFTRSPEITGTDFVAHSTLSGGMLFSPGTKEDGSLFDVDPQFNLVINEFYANPAADEGELMPGDANNDGERSPSGDEFIEFFNKGHNDLDISGWKVSDVLNTPTLRHVFPDNTIVPAGKAVVVFGGGTPTGEFGGSIVQTASEGSGLVLTNGGDSIVVTNAVGDTIIHFGYGAVGDKSLTLEPEIFGAVYVSHDTATINMKGTFFSPGTMADGIPFAYMPYDYFVINEIHADPANNVDTEMPGDANGDGERINGSDDEFIEFVNGSLLDLDISGWQIIDTNSQVSVRHIFPDNTVVPAGGAIVVFGGGTPTGTFGNSIVQVASSTSLGVSNSNELLYIVNTKEDTVITHGILDYNNDMSWTRDPDITGETFVEHSTATGSGGALYSPGTKIDGSLFIIPEATLVQFSAADGLVTEGDASIDIEIAIAAPSNINATTADLVLTSGSATDINDYTTQTLTFPAGSVDAQTVTITITDDDEVEPNDTLIFELQNIAGGTTAELGAVGSFKLVITDNDFASSTLVINEFLAWPAGSTSDDPTVDANGDGVANFEEDEFIEFVNSGTEDIDLSGWKIFDEVTGNDPLRHIFPPGTSINPGGALTVFGGGVPTGEFGGSPVMVASQVNQGLGLTNTGDKIIVKNASDETVLELSYGQQVRGTSQTLDPDITGSLGSHPVLNDLNISPGTKIDGSPFVVPVNTQVSFLKTGGGLMEDATEDGVIELTIIRPDENEATMAEVVITSIGFEGDITYETQTVTFPAGSEEIQSVTVSSVNDSEIEGDEFFIFSIGTVTGGSNAKKGSPSTFELVIIDDDVPLIFNEILADPATGSAGDSNNDGDHETAEDINGDEFIEVVNISDAAVDMSGYEFHDATGQRHIFEPGTVLGPGKAIVVFGSGIPTGEFGGSIVQLSSSGSLDLDDEGDTLYIYNTSETIVAKTIYGKLANDNQSITRSPDFTGGFVKHSTAEGAEGANFSPGTKVDGATTVLSVGKRSRFLSVYPNPATTELKVSTKSINENIVLKIFDLSGSTVRTVQVMKNNIEYLDISTIQRGFFVYEIRVLDTGLLIDKGKIIFGE